jgi:hypothetical protein
LTGLVLGSAVSEIAEDQEERGRRIAGDVAGDIAPSHWRS